MSCGIENVVVMTLGNELKGDDGAGILFGRLIKERSSVKVIEGGDAPENSTGIIIKHCPETIIIADALDFGGKPGETICIPGENLEGYGISTHGSLGLLVDYLKKTTGACITVLGFQPRSLNLGEKISEEVSEGVRKIARIFIETGGFAFREL